MYMGYIYLIYYAVVITTIAMSTEIKKIRKKPRKMQSELSKEIRSIEDDIKSKKSIVKQKWPLNYIPPEHLRLEMYDYGIPTSTCNENKNKKKDFDSIV